MQLSIDNHKGLSSSEDLSGLYIISWENTPGLIIQIRYEPWWGGMYHNYQGHLGVWYYYILL